MARDGEGIVWLIAVGWVVLSWIMKAVKGTVRQAGRQPGPIDDKPDAGELRERRERLRLERARQRQLKASNPSTRDSALTDLRRELERVMGVHVEEEHGPAGRRSTIRLEPAEEVEEGESLEVAPEVVSLEVSGDRAARVVVDQDSEAEGIVQRRLAVAESHSRPLTRADHQRFDQSIRAGTAAVPKQAAPTPPAGRQSMRQAFIWSEVLGKPVSER